MTTQRVAIEEVVTIEEIWLENRRGASEVGLGLGIGEATPRLSWIASGAAEMWLAEFRLDDGEVERATIEATAGSTRLVAWPFTPLRSRRGGELRLRATAADAAWSAPVRVEAGLLERDDWVTPFVSPSPAAPPAADGELRPGYLLRATWDAAALGIAPDTVRRARVYASAHGVYELELNGRPVADGLLAPGWTSYRHRLRTQTHDVTELVREGRNAIGAWLADGWYRGRIGFDGGLWNVYGTDVALLLQLELTLDDDSVVRVPLDEEWTWHPSPITEVGLYEGERYDARLLPAGWSEPGFDDSHWSRPVLLPLEQFPARLEAPSGPPVRVIETLRPESVERLEGGRIRLDFGQNISGKLRIRVAGPAGHVVRLHHAEVLENGALGVRPLRAAVSIDEYVCAGGGGGDDRGSAETWSPRFTIHGFRYAELEGWPGELDTVDVEALVVHTDMPRTGWFESSHEGLNRLHSNVVWSMRDNFVDLPTDCPQRDERLGWTGDIQVFAPTALRLYAAHGTLTGWLRDLAEEQAEQGHVPNFVPWLDCGFPNFPTAAWGDAAVIVPWELYQHDGDLRVLETQYDSMRGWVDLVDRLSGGTGLWNTGFQLGDWLDPAAPPESPGDSHTDKYLVATAYHVRTAGIMAETAALLGRVDDEQRYGTLAARALAAFQGEYLSSSGRVVSDTPTSLALCIVFGLFASPEQQRRAGERLLELVAQNDFRISTGFVGTPIICDALAMVGGMDAAYHLLLQDELPSWLYQVSMGATTIWERWDSMLPDGTVNPGDMTSFNHYALGAVAGFMHRVVAGLDVAAPGGVALRIAPRPGGGLTHASSSHLGTLGLASSAWRREGALLTLDVVVPLGATATVELPDGRVIDAVPAGQHTFTSIVRAVADDPPRPPKRWRGGPPPELSDSSPERTSSAALDPTR
ncbi:alpha-L-rhamnosidase [Agromyces subbeticus]|uniref:alpha-L-rhamnosidase n=1 Tax=Agromyces subbeticus TaxID=293890 RepID=UPI0003B4E354|nr:alpha-L-rhamnosidase [Agromyces subbeticus]